MTTHICNKNQQNIYKNVCNCTQGNKLDIVGEGEDKGEGTAGQGLAVSLTSHYQFHLLQRHLDISQLITPESSPLHIASSQTQTENLWFPGASH